jgi:hypothetical protein
MTPIQVEVTGKTNAEFEKNWDRIEGNILKQGFFYWFTADGITFFKKITGAGEWDYETAMMR